MIVEEESPSAITGPDPVIVEFAATAPAEVKTTLPSAFERGVTIERIFVSGIEDFREQVEIPKLSVTEHAP